MTCTIATKFDAQDQLNGLQSKGRFDKVSSLNGKPSAQTEGLTLKNSDLAKSDIVDNFNPTVTESPNLYKQNGVLMSKIPYNFRAIPDEFLTDEFIDDPIMMRFIRWIFKRISTKGSSVSIKNRSKNLELEPYEFIYGRLKCSEEAGISLKQAERKLGQLVGSNWCSKVGSKSGSTFSVYRLMTGNFVQNGGQQNGQQNGQHLGHNQDIRSKEQHVDVVPEKILAKEKKVKPEELTKSDVYRINLSKSLGWEPEEIESAWEAMEPRKNEISDMIAYLGGIIQRNRVKKQNEENKKCQKPQRTTVKDRYPTQKENYIPESSKRTCVISNGL